MPLTTNERGGDQLTFCFLSLQGIQDVILRFLVILPVGLARFLLSPG